jgi:DNA mismatch repair protein MutS2
LTMTSKRVQKPEKTRDNGRNAPISRELDLHAMTVDEALPIIHEYLNDAFMAGMKEVRIVHGKGTGILRQAVMRELKGHPLVKTYRIGDRFEGSTGATVVEF